MGQPAPSQEGQPADLGMRILAKLIDGLLVGIVYGPLSIMVGFATRGIINNIVTSVLLAALYIGYLSFMESSQGNTVGKMLLKLKVVGPNGGNPTMDEAVKRNIYFGAALVGVIPFIGWILQPLVWLGAIIFIIVSINGDPIGQGWHDKFAGGTRVVKAA